MSKMFTVWLLSKERRFTGKAEKNFRPFILFRVQSIFPLKCSGGCTGSRPPRSHKRNFVALLSGGASVPLPLKCIAFQR